MMQSFVTVLLTRPKPASQAFARLLRSGQSTCPTITISPLLRIDPVEADYDLSLFQGVIFSSANGVALAGAGHGVPAYCVGEATTKASSEKGWQATLAGRDADELIGTLCAQFKEGQIAGPLLHLAGAFRRGNIAARLAQSGLSTEEVVLYRQSEEALSQEARQVLSRENPIVVPLFSPRTARIFAKQANGSVGPIHVVAMSKAVKDALEDFPAASVLVAEQPNAETMRHSVQSTIARLEGGRLSG